VEFDVGVDFLDLLFKLEWRLRFKLRIEDFGVAEGMGEEILRSRKRLTLTAGDIFEAVVWRLERMTSEATKRDIPYPDEWKRSREQIWEVVQFEIAKVAKVQPQNVTPESRIVEDLGFT
jgi:hypothetical protein